MILKNADIFDFDFNLHRADLRVEDGLIAEIGENLSGAEEHDLSGCVSARIYRHTYSRLRWGGFLRRSAGHARNNVENARKLRRDLVLPASMTLP